VKRTDYFRYMRKRPDRAQIREAWLERAVNHPESEQIQADGRIRRWIWIEEAGTYLRFILLEDGETLHHAFLTGVTGEPNPRTKQEEAIHEDKVLCRHGYCPY
jgi:hypothetical protein